MPVSKVPLPTSSLLGSGSGGGGVATDGPKMETLSRQNVEPPDRASWNVSWAAPSEPHVNTPSTRSPAGVGATARLNDWAKVTGLCTATVTAGAAGVLGGAGSAETSNPMVYCSPCTSVPMPSRLIATSHGLAPPAGTAAHIRPSGFVRPGQASAVGFA